MSTSDWWKTLSVTFVAATASSLLTFWVTSCANGRDKLDNRVTTLETGMSGLQASVKDLQSSVLILLEKNLHQASALPQHDFDTQLPRLAPTLRAVRKAGGVIPSDVTAELRERVQLAPTSTPGYWPTAAALASVDSPQQPPALPDCSTQKPYEHLYWENMDQPGRNENAPPDQFTYKNCTLDLNKPFSQTVFNTRTPSDGISFICDHCVVKYDGGPIPLFGMRAYVHIILKTCLFYITSGDAPPTRGQQLIASALEAPAETKVNFSA